MGALDGKVAIITGASSGIGNAAAKLFAREGAKVIVTARRRAELDELVAEIDNTGGRAIAVPGDVRDEMGPVFDLSLSGWRETLEINLTSAFLGAKYQVPAMIARGGGSIIFTSTFVGHTLGFPGMAAYAASKAGLVGLTRVLAAEFGAKAIRANAILAGGTDTPMGRIVANTPEAHSFVESLHALKRISGALGNRPSGAVPSLRRVKLCHGDSLRGRGRCVDHADLTSTRARQPT